MVIMTIGLTLVVLSISARFQSPTALSSAGAYTFEMQYVVIEIRIDGMGLPVRGLGYARRCGDNCMWPVYDCHTCSASWLASTGCHA